MRACCEGGLGAEAAELEFEQVLSEAALDNMSVGEYLVCSLRVGVAGGCEKNESRTTLPTESAT